MKHIFLFGSIILCAALSLASTLVITQRSRNHNTQIEDTVVKAKVAAASGPNSQAIPYKIGGSMRSRIERILWIVIEPESFTRDKMVMLASQLNQDFPDERRIYAVFFDSETAARNYDPAGGSYPISKKLERGQYYLDRVRGRESINFSSQRGNSVDEIKITL
jgi:hypothetical protein